MEYDTLASAPTFFYMKKTSTFRQVWLAAHYIVLQETHSKCFWGDLTYSTPELECYARFASPMTYDQFLGELSQGLNIIKKIQFLKCHNVRKIDFNEIQTLYQNILEIRQNHSSDSHRRWPEHYDTQCQKFGLTD